MAKHALLGSLQPDILVSMATAPLLFALVGVRHLVDQGIVLGQTSEEIFRGDRLPTLS